MKFQKHKKDVSVNRSLCVKCEAPVHCNNHKKENRPIPACQKQKREAKSEAPPGQHAEVGHWKDDEEKKVKEPEKSRKDQLLQLFQELYILCGAAAVDAFPRNGFQSLNDAITLCQARYLFRNIHDSVCKLICPSDSSFYKLEDQRNGEPDTRMVEVKANMLKMIQSETRTARLAVESLLAASYERAVATELMDINLDSNSDSSGATIRKQRFRSRQKLFQHLITGQDILKHNYSF